MKILALNIGNSRTTAALVLGKTVRHVRHFTSPCAPTELRTIAPAPDGIALCSVAPKKNAAWEHAAARAFPNLPRLWIHHALHFGIPISLTAPRQTGHDRYADAVAAAALCGTPCIACDFGTATTFNLVLPHKGFVGGAIAPGFGMWFESLHNGAAQIPAIPPSGAARRLPYAGNTANALRLGARWGFRGMVAEILYQLTQSAGPNARKMAYCATGGWAPHVLRDCGLNLPHLPHLTLLGIARLYHLNPPH